MTIAMKHFEVVDCGFDEYPGDGLRIRLKGSIAADKLREKHFIDDMGFGNDVKYGDEIEITVRIVSRVDWRRVPV